MELKIYNISPLKSFIIPSPDQIRKYRTAGINHKKCDCDSFSDKKAKNPELPEMADPCSVTNLNDLI